VLASSAQGLLDLEATAHAIALFRRAWTDEYSARANPPFPTALGYATL
jgi:hypothetical protein